MSDHVYRPLNLVVLVKSADYTIALAVTASASPILRLTNDLALRPMLVPVFLAVPGGAFALIWFNRGASSN